MVVPIHENIIRNFANIEIYDSGDDEKEDCLGWITVMEKCDGNLREKLKNENPTLKERIKIATGIKSGLKYLKILNNVKLFLSSKIYTFAYRPFFVYIKTNSSAEQKVRSFLNFSLTFFFFQIPSTFQKRIFSKNEIFDEEIAETREIFVICVNLVKKRFLVFNRRRRLLSWLRLANYACLRC